jgi:hypothetical protein
MCDKPKQFPEIPPPKTAEELLALKNRDHTCTPLDDRCRFCGGFLYRSGDKVWCGNRCDDETERLMNKVLELKKKIVEMEDIEKKRITEYMGLIKDVMR